MTQLGMRQLMQQAVTPISFVHRAWLVVDGLCLRRPRKVWGGLKTILRETGPQLVQNRNHLSATSHELVAAVYDCLFGPHGLAYRRDSEQRVLVYLELFEQSIFKFGIMRTYTAA
jgi:hypothetical protein